ncbi:MAG: hypothetical protein M3323_13260, partial [Actinomycetota bacterium]|nr:hypothetical protein [Actinomycetota bacterium]
MKRPTKTWLTIVAVLAVVALVAAACNEEDPEPRADGGDPECTWVIGTMGALSGDAASLGKPIAEGVEYAVNEANDEGELPCE